MTIADDVTTRECPACRASVPAAKFCGECGAQAGVPVTTLSVLLRPRVYATAHREPVWSPRVTSTLFPRFPGRIRIPFRIGLICVLIAIVVLAVLRMNGPLGVTATVGWPLLFLLYVWQADGFRDIPPGVWATAMVVGIASGVGWWLTAGTLLADFYDVSTASSLALTRVLNTGYLIMLGGAALMLAPAFLCRLIPVTVRESLDGFVVGAFGALWYSTASTTTIVAPQFAEGLIEDHSAGRMLQDSMTYGIVDPLVTTAAGGLVGLSLWFRSDERRSRLPGRTRGALLFCALGGVVSYVAVWTIDGLGLPRAVDVGAKLAVAALAVLIIRAGVQIALLHELKDVASGTPLLCVHCERVVPDLPFCSACGAAARASSRTSRRFRHEHPPVREPSPL